MLAGREKEVKRLEKALKSDKAELIAIFGRRRVGKTFLIREVYQSHIQFELTGLHNGLMADQLENFHFSLSNKLDSIEKPKSWLQAFGQLSEYMDGLSSKKKKVIFIDEFPWLATRKSKFLMAFEHFWNSYAVKKNDLIVVICGSAASYMVKKIVRNKGGLHNRITEKIRLLPFNLYETKLFLKSKKIHYSDYDILKIYMTIGGVPFYLDKLEKGESVPQAIDRMFFHKDAPLRNEFKDVFASLFENHERHSAVIRALANSRKGISRKQILKKTGLVTGGRLTQTLEELEESGFIEVYHSFGNLKKDALYRLNDEYSLFYLKFIEQSRAKGKGTWLAKSNGQAYKSWLGFSFETVCLKHIEEIKKALGIAAVDSENHSWSDKNEDEGAQIDLLIDRADNVINICEMKFYSAEFTIDKKYANELRNKVNLFRENSNTRKNLFLTMITTYGLKQNPYSLELVQNELKMNALFKPID
ncbi:MAG: ATP-binding protein [Chitinophagales bacterium]